MSANVNPINSRQALFLRVGLVVCLLASAGITMKGCSGEPLRPGSSHDLVAKRQQDDLFIVVGIVRDERGSPVVGYVLTLPEDQMHVEHLGDDNARTLIVNGQAVWDSLKVPPPVLVWNCHEGGCPIAVEAVSAEWLNNVFRKTLVRAGRVNQLRDILAEHGYPPEEKGPE